MVWTAPATLDVSRFQWVGCVRVIDVIGPAASGNPVVAGDRTALAGMISRSASLKSFRITLTFSRESSACTGGRVAFARSGLFPPWFCAGSNRKGFSFFTHSPTGADFLDAATATVLTAGAPCELPAALVGRNNAGAGPFGLQRPSPELERVLSRSMGSSVRGFTARASAFVLRKAEIGSFFPRNHSWAPRWA